MNVRVLKDYLESAGILGIIISLVFVGLELRQNTSIAKIDAYEAYIGNIIEIQNEMSGNPTLAALVIRANISQGDQEFDAAESGMLYSFFYSMMYARSGLFTAIEEGILSEDYIGPIERTSIFDNDFYRSVWPRQRESFDESFVEYVEALPWNTQRSE